MGLTRIRAEQISDIDYKQATRVVSLADINLSGGAPKIVDGVSLNTNDRVLVAGQATASENGLYFVSVAGTGSNGTWTRTTDGNTTGEINAGMIVMVTEGTEWADTSWKLVTDDPIVIGTTDLIYLQNTGNSFSIINVVGSSNVIANGVSTQVSFVSGNNISITGNNAADTITFDVVQSPSFTGNITASYYIGNGSQLTGISASNIIGAYSNANVANYLPTFSGDLGNVGNITASGNIVAANISATGNISATYFIGNGSQLTGVEATNANANSLIGNTLSSNVVNSSLTTVGTLANLNVSGNVSATGNVTGNNLFMYGSANILGNLNVQGNITFIDSNVIVTNDLAIELANNQSTYANINNAGILAGNSGNSSLINLTYSYLGNSWTTNIGISAVGNIAGNYIIGDGSLLSNINASNIVGAYSNANVANYLPTYSGNFTANNISATGNITIQNVVANVDVSAAGNVTANVVNWSNNGNVVVHQVYNSSTGSLDTIFN